MFFRLMVSTKAELEETRVVVAVLGLELQQ